MSEEETSSTGDGQATETEEVAPEPQEQEANESVEASETQTEEWLIPGKFKTAQDLAEHYKETESYATKLAQENAELRRQSAQPTPPPASIPEDPEMAEARRIVKQIAEEVVEQKVAPIRNKDIMREFENQLSKAVAKYPSADEELVKAKLLANPHMSVMAAAKASHEKVEKLRKSSVDNYVTGLSKSGRGEKASRDYVVSDTSAPKSLEEAEMKAMERFQ